ncbi:MAG: PAS domain S-box protein [Smithellaceae bacterium]|nr:PAS domain S-box protein [Smithellaceae bacterium]
MGKDQVIVIEPLEHCATPEVKIHFPHIVEAPFLNIREGDDGISLAEFVSYLHMRRIGDMAFCKDRNFRYLFGSNAYCEKILKCSQEECIGLDDAEIAATFGKQSALGRLAESGRQSDLQTSQAGRTCHFDLELEIGEENICLELIKAPLLEENGSLAGIVGYARDVTKRKRMEKALRASELRYRTLVEKATVGIAVIKDDRILFCNEKVSSRLGAAKPEELFGLSFLDMLSPEDLDDLRAVRDRIFRGEEMDSPGIFRTTYRGGQEGIVEYVVVRFPYEGYDDSLLLFLIDVTKREKAQDEIRKFKAIADSANYGIAIVTLEGKITYTNNYFASVHGYEVGEVLGQNLRVLHPEDQRPRIERIFSDLLRQGEVKAIELKQRRKDGTTFPMLMNLVLAKDRKGEPLFIAGSAVDITELKRKEGELRRSEAELKRKSDRLEEANTALKVLLRNRDEERMDLEQKIMANVKRLVVPYIDRLRKSELNGRQNGYLDSLEISLKEVLSNFLGELTSQTGNLTPKEIQVANLIRQGRNTRDIATLMGIGCGAVNLHRNHIRTKLGLTRKKINLRSYLLSLG